MSTWHFLSAVARLQHAALRVERKAAARELLIQSRDAAAGQKKKPGQWVGDLPSEQAALPARTLDTYQCKSRGRTLRQHVAAQ
jgi:hypothetical protein